MVYGEKNEPVSDKAVRTNKHNSKNPSTKSKLVRALQKVLIQDGKRRSGSPENKQL